MTVAPSPVATILVADDNPENRALAQATLEDEGYRVLLARGGAEAIELFQRDAPDCVLMDVRMPGVDGLVACERIRALPGGGEVPIIFVTALRDVETFDQALRAGGDDFITKPVRPTELIVRMQAALKLRRMHAERTELYALIRTQRDDLLRLQLHKEQLTAFLVHDLKNPVNAIGLHAHRILRDAGATERSQDAATRIQAETAALLRLILNLLDISRGDENRLPVNRATIDLGQLVDDVLAAMSVRARTSQIELRRALEVTQVVADPDLLRRVLENLLDNAIRHAPEDSAVTVRADAVPGAVELRVADAGPGIPPDARARVFERFVQHGDAGGAPGRGNHGLGLTFCKLVAEAHGGRIWIEDGAPGAVFVVRLPTEGS